MRSHLSRDDNLHAAAHPNFFRPQSIAYMDRDKHHVVAVPLATHSTRAIEMTLHRLLDSMSTGIDCIVKIGCRLMHDYGFRVVHSYVDQASHVLSAFRAIDIHQHDLGLPDMTAITAEYET